jgi:hypothetical protein
MESLHVNALHDIEIYTRIQPHVTMPFEFKPRFPLETLTLLATVSIHTLQLRVFRTLQSKDISPSRPAQVRTPRTILNTDVNDATALQCADMIDETYLKMDDQSVRFVFVNSQYEVIKMRTCLFEFLSLSADASLTVSALPQRECARFPRVQSRSSFS